MPKTIQQYRVFIGSPGGLEDERLRFSKLLEKFSRLHAERQGAQFHPVGWEDTVGGVGRPQSLINDELAECDYAVFIFHDRWGSLTGEGKTVGTEEELRLAEKLYSDSKIRNIALFFKTVDPGKLRDPGPQLQSVIDFKKRIESEKKYLFRQFDNIDAFTDALEACLTQWLSDHAKISALPTDVLATGSELAGNALSIKKPVEAPTHDYWIAEAEQLLDSDSTDYATAAFFAAKAADAASSVVQWAYARNLGGIAQLRLGKFDEAIAAFTEIFDRTVSSSKPAERSWQATALLNKGFALGALDRSADELAIYDDLIARFGMATELPLREQAAKALLNKGVRLSTLGRAADALAVYDDLLARFGTAKEVPLREQVAKALLNKGVQLGDLERGLEAIAVYDDLIARFGTATELPLRIQVAMVFLNKAIQLGDLTRSAEALAVYSDLITCFGTASELVLREQVAKALVNSGTQLNKLDCNADAIIVFDDVIRRFGNATERPLRGQVAMALVNKGVALSKLDRSMDEIAVYDDVIARFGTETDLALRLQVATALFYKGLTLGTLNRTQDAIAVFEEVAARFSAATEVSLRGMVAKAATAKENLLQVPTSQESASDRAMP